MALRSVSESAAMLPQSFVLAMCSASKNKRRKLARIEG
jgi:hypothetical protein